MEEKDIVLISEEDFEFEVIISEDAGIEIADGASSKPSGGPGCSPECEPGYMPCAPRR
jgi:hypothetical protein